MNLSTLSIEVIIMSNLTPAEILANALAHSSEISAKALAEAKASYAEASAEILSDNLERMADVYEEALAEDIAIGNNDVVLASFTNAREDKVDELTRASVVTAVVTTAQIGAVLVSLPATLAATSVAFASVASVILVGALIAIPVIPLWNHWNKLSAAEHQVEIDEICTGGWVLNLLLSSSLLVPYLPVPYFAIATRMIICIVRAPR